MSEAQEPRLVRPDEFGILADALGDSPDTVISVHLLAWGLCNACLVGDPQHLRGLLIQNRQNPGEPIAFGSDAPTLWELLKAARGWWSVNVSESCASQLGAIVEEEIGRAVRYYGDVYHTLTQPVAPIYHEVVRLLDSTDLEILVSASPEVRRGGWGSAERLLREGVAAGAIAEGRLVAIAYTSARSRKHADIAVNTLEEWRGQGLATAAASLVAREVQERGQVPIWSCGEDNYASLHVAHRLGFAEVLRRTYVIPQEW